MALDTVTVIFPLAQMLIQSKEYYFLMALTIHACAHNID